MAVSESSADLKPHFLCKGDPSLAFHHNERLIYWKVQLILKAFDLQNFSIFRSQHSSLEGTQPHCSVNCTHHSQKCVECSCQPYIEWPNDLAHWKHQYINPICRYWEFIWKVNWKGACWVYAYGTIGCLRFVS